MGQYKVPQNVEAEDHILGPLTFKQFIYFLIAIGWAFLSFAIFRSVPVLMLAIGSPVIILFMLLAFFNRDGQDFEHLMLAVVGFFAASRRRLWRKEALAETFHIQAPKPVAEISQRNSTQVISELEKLATLIDSRGWNQPVPDATLYNPTLPTAAHADRPVLPPIPASQPIQPPPADMLDVQNSPIAQNLNVMLQQAAADVRQQAMASMSQPGAAAAPQPSISGVTAYPTGDILKLATQSEGLSVAQVAAQATRLAPVAAMQQPVEQPNGR